MSSRPAKIILRLTLLAAVCAVGVNAQQPAKAPASGAKAASEKQTAKTTPATPEKPTAAGGLVVFIDPATGRIRQPDAAEIGTLSGVPSAALVQQPITAPVEFRGPGNSVGVKLGADSLSYMVVTKTPDGKLVEDCVTGDKAAAALVSKGATPKTTAAPKSAKEALDDK